MTLVVTGKDIFSGAEIIISYSIFADSDVIASSVRIVNPTPEVISIEKLLSVQLDFHHNNFDLISLNDHRAKKGRFTVALPPAFKWTAAVAPVD